MVTVDFLGVAGHDKTKKSKKRKMKKTAIRHEDGMAAPPHPLPPRPAALACMSHCAPPPAPQRGLPQLGAAGRQGGWWGAGWCSGGLGGCGWGGSDLLLSRAGGSVALWVGGFGSGQGRELFCFPVETVWTGQGAGRCGFGFIVHLQGDGGVKAAPSGAVLVDLESGIGRGTGLATGGGGGSKNDPGTLPWPLPLGCEQHK